jgi:hypothetical protein
MHWGKGLVIVFAVFVVGVLTVVGIAVSRRVDLVTDGYYERGLLYQEQIDRIQRTRRLQDTISVQVSPEGILLAFPGMFASTEISGEVSAYRPDDRLRDFVLPIGLDAQRRMLVPRALLGGGIWRLRITWSARGDEYYTEHRQIMP